MQRGITTIRTNYRTIVNHFRSFNSAVVNSSFAGGNQMKSSASSHEGPISFETRSSLDKNFVLPGNVSPNINATLPDEEQAFQSKVIPSRSVNFVELNATDFSDKQKLFNDLFPCESVKSRFTVMTISQFTTNDMSFWNQQVELERGNLITSFIDGAKVVCEGLKQAGFWADFVDPSSGKPFYGEYTNSSMLETDDRMRKLGFKIVDYGCCKVLSHALWKTNVFVGCIFTDAPFDHPIIKSLK